ncbi:MAG: electron transporter RnfG [Deltaproteobacteria bacterium]|nr:MAG: electron transporter RnfG [Deltaproteobacteria bacterium]
MREILKLIVVLTAFCAVSAFSLAFVKEATKDRIEYQKLKMLVAPAVKAVFPSYDNDPIMERIKVKLGKKQIVTVFPAKRGGKLIGIGYETMGSGHGGPVEVMLALSPEGKILGVKVVKHAETPGIGTKATDSEEFLSQFKGKGLGSKIALTAAGGEIEAVSGATESSAAITEAVSKGMELFLKVKDQIKG